MAGTFVILRALDHAFAAFRSLPLGHPAADLTGWRLRRTDGDGPVGLLHVARAEEFAETRSRCRVTGDEKQARCFLVEPVDQFRAIFAVRENVQHAVDMAPALLGAALDGDACRLVQREHVIILIDDHFPHELLIARGRLAGLVGFLFFRGGLVDRWQAHNHTGLKARIGLGAAAIDTDLAGAKQLFELALRDLKTALHPAVEANAFFLRADGFVDDLLVHARTFRMINMPVRTRARPRMTERPA